ncbi:hypothetical protein POPTR_001G438400v4 [Populus trichocarpa]|uniref:Protein kinase domain-containing protein n=1 Tax=Populus trichocarpa TaxID=3694 RepID=A0A2K2CCW6_POPTR|nr:cold-responsive protein kinase 1 [Populus trichocarpa]KAI5605820.1 hypothetical protein BDE02_01G377700 [Populus trichocarpa]PNT59875.1 hypothetical protein POPTR_001G438400v4 [Populus trichocarpa]|eukprot:XP_024449516.1 cold-responsive protein kinase 1 [Populus trichocarpa]
MTCFSFLCGRRIDSSQESQHMGRDDEELGSIKNVRCYTYRELRNATEGFSAANKIGEGGFGSVYKGRLKHGKIAAIKVLSAESRQGVEEFLAEIKAMSEIEHENLVKLYGCCVEDNHRILVYNYLENNSLAQTLLDGGHSHSNIQFSWRTRTKICIGVARGLTFLHEEVKPYIVHRDIKASNILLDKDLTAKISDFGLAKLIPDNQTHVSTRVAGTLGYLAPEYAIRGKLTRKADLYSFGVLLLEIVSGRNNTNTRLPVEEQYLLERTWELYERRELVSLVDASLNGDFNAEEACRFLKIGLLCTQDDPNLRPSMSTVVKMLTGRKNFDERKITKPGLISDFMDLKVRAPSKTKASASTSFNVSSGSDNQDTSILTSENSSSVTMTAFTELYNRSI